MLKSTISKALPRRPATDSKSSAIVCFSHLRWDFVYQRPQHLMSRLAQNRRVFYVEEPTFGAQTPGIQVSVRENGLRVVVPALPNHLSEEQQNSTLRHLVDRFLDDERIDDFAAWYYTPMALPWTRHLDASAIVYDCMDELSLFRGAPAEMLERERELIQRADVIFTGGTSLYEAKRTRSPNVHCFPSSVDAKHFGKARTIDSEPADQASIPPFRLGFAGVIDERMDIELLDALAAARPDWQIVLVGPVVKIDPAQLPRRANIHYLGARAYADLPAFMSGWDIGLLPFALNESTRFISPTKTPEYLAAGLPVVSTPIRDVVAPYGTSELVYIGRTASDFVEAIESELARSSTASAYWLARVDEFLSTMSWDRTHDQMSALIDRAIAKNAAVVKEVSISQARRPATSVVKHYDIALEA